MKTLTTLLEYGPIVAFDEEMALAVTINGAYLNLWSERGEGKWSNIDARATDTPNGLYHLTVAEAMDRGDGWLAEIRAGYDAKDES